MKLIDTFLDQILNGQKIERTQNSFFHLKKINYTNKLMSQLNVDGKVIKDQKNKLAEGQAAFLFHSPH